MSIFVFEQRDANNRSKQCFQIPAFACTPGAGGLEFEICNANIQSSTYIQISPQPSKQFVDVHFLMAVHWQRSNSYGTALDSDFCCASEKYECPSITTVCPGLKSKSNSVRIFSGLDVWKTSSQNILLEFNDLTYKVKRARNGKNSFSNQWYYSSKWYYSDNYFKKCFLYMLELNVFSELWNKQVLVMLRWLSGGIFFVSCRFATDCLRRGITLFKEASEKRMFAY